MLNQGLSEYGPHAAIGACRILAGGSTVFVYWLDATPETVPGLAEAIDPLEYLGLNGASMGGMVLVILAGILGATEFQSHIMNQSIGL